ncbi:MAG TPA: polymer-forming cytoskeletal protein, partial [Candidatus Sulfotelmatobacter sp.]|nr:polymer-forming cytoskeletal protein [Candidatus Sulfotelmatobacter sp.]
ARWPRTPQATNFKTNRWNGVRREQGAGREPKEGRMLQSSENSFLKSGSPASNPNTFNPVKTVTAPVDQATIGRTLVIKGEITGSEALYIDGRIEGKIIMPESRVTVGRNGKVDASIQAREVVVMGKVNGNIECSDRVDIRAEGAVSGDISTVRISVEDGAALKGGIQVRAEGKNQGKQEQKQEQPKALAATASA